MTHLLTRFLTVMVLLGGVIYIFLNYKPAVSEVQSKAEQLISGEAGPGSAWEKCGADCEEKIREFVNQAVATLSAKPSSAPAPAAKKTATPEPTAEVNYIHLENVGLTTRNEWSDLDGTDFTYNPATYGNVTEVRWIPRIKTTQGGEVSSRLFDVSNGTAVPGSEVSTRNTSFTEVESGMLTLGSGKNTYRVQIRSAAGYEANFERGKVKITSK